MVLSSNSISLTTRESAVATWEASWGEGSKSSDREGTRAGEEERRQQPKEGAEEDQRKKLQEQLTLEKERKLKEQRYQEEQEQKRRQEEAQEQKRQAERERETSVKIYQYRRFVLQPEGTVLYRLALAQFISLFRGSQFVPTIRFLHKQPKGDLLHCTPGPVTL